MVMNTDGRNSAIVFTAALLAGAVLAWPARSRAWWAEFNYGDNLADSSVMPRTQITWAYVRYEDRSAASVGTNVGIRGCSHPWSAYGVDCASWTYLDATPSAPTGTQGIKSKYLASDSLAKLTDGSRHNYFDFLRMTDTATSTTVKVHAVIYGSP